MSTCSLAAEHPIFPEPSDGNGRRILLPPPYLLFASPTFPLAGALLSQTLFVTLFGPFSRFPLSRFCLSSPHFPPGDTHSTNLSLACLLEITAAIFRHNHRGGGRIEGDISRPGRRSVHLSLSLSLSARCSNNGGEM